MQLKDCGLIVLGGGRMGTAIAKGLLARGSLVRNKLALVEANSGRAEELRQDKELRQVAVSSHVEGMASPDILLLAVKPHEVAPSLKACAAIISPKTLVISIAAGIGTKDISAALPLNQPVIRAMPNTAVLIGRGVTALAPAPQVSPYQLTLAHELFNSVGMSVDVPESQMNAVTALSGSGPAYVAVFIEALIDAGVAQGLNRETAAALAHATVQGASQMITGQGLHPAQLKDMVTSPGGTTIAGLAVLEKAGLRGIIMAAVKAAAMRGQELG